jgi:hypothetical protein
MKPQSPVFHIPIGYCRDESGTVVMFVNDDEQRAAGSGQRQMAGWNTCCNILPPLPPARSSS